MAAPARIQTSGIATGTGSAVASLTGVVAGNTIVVMFFQTASGTRTYTVSDDIDGSYAQRAYDNVSRATGIFSLHNSSGGNLTITVQANTGTVGVTAIAIEIDPATFDAADAYNNATNTGTQLCSLLGIGTAVNAYVIAGGVLNASGGTLTKNADFTLVNSATNYMIQDWSSAGALVAEQAEWTNSTIRTSNSAIASFVAAGGSTYTLTCDTGSFALTSIAADLRASRRVAPTTASFALTGIDSALTANRRIAPITASYTLTGIDAGLRTSRRLTANVQSFALTGIDAGLRATRLVTATTQSYALTGINANLTYTPTGGPTHTLTCDTGSFALTGIATGLIAARRIAPVIATFTLTGIVASTLARRRIAPITATFAQTNIDAAFRINRRLAPIAASYVLTGRPANLNYSGAASSRSSFYYYLMLGS